MDAADTIQIFLVTTPGLEPSLCAEARAAGFADAAPVLGGVTMQGGWPEVWRANLTLRGATRVLARMGSFRAMHLAQLDKRARRFPFAETLRPDVPLRIEVTCTASRIYHQKAATERIAAAIRDGLGAPVTPEGEVILKVRIEDDLCTFSIDTTGDPLHKRGHKEAVGKAPMRESLAAAFLNRCGYDGREPVVDPMCGSGTFLIEAAEIAMGLNPGRTRSFAFEKLAGFDATAWATMRNSAPGHAPPVRFLGCDRDDGAIRMATANAARAGVGDYIDFHRQAISDLVPPAGPPGLVIVNPPYGARIGERKLLHAVYGALGKTLKDRFRGWRVGIVTSDAGLAKSTGLPFLPPDPPVSHGGLKIQLFRTARLS